MNIAYIISAYKLPDLLVRLVKRLDAPGTSTFIHVDAKTSDDVNRRMTEPLRDRPGVHFLPRHACYWGDFGHVGATLKGLRALVESGRPFDYVILLTGQDYPLKSNAEIAATLREAAGQVFMYCIPIPNEDWTGGLDRIENWHFRITGCHLSFPASPFPLDWMNAAWSPLGRFVPRRSFPSGLRPYGGSSYWMMPADCARHVDDFVRVNPAFVRFFRYVYVPDEIFFPTIVMNSPFRSRIAEDDLRFEEWQEHSDSPNVLTTDSFERLMRTPKLIGRKFDPNVDSRVLDLLDLAHDGR